MEHYEEGGSTLASPGRRLPDATSCVALQGSGLGLRVEGLGSRVEGLGLTVEIGGFRV